MGLVEEISKHTALGPARGALRFAKCPFCGKDHAFWVNSVKEDFGCLSCLAEGRFDDFRRIIKAHKRGDSVIS